MPNFAANLTTLFNEVPMLERFERAADAGFEAVEILFPYEFDKRGLTSRLQAYNLRPVLINLPPGNWEEGERGFAAIPGRENEFRESVESTLIYARAIDCPIVHAMAGIVEDGLNNTRAVDAYLSNLAYASNVFGENGIGVVIEPLNTRAAPGYLISHQWEARNIIERVGHKNLGLQFDFYHVQIMEGDLAVRFKEFLPIIRHVQIAGVPERHEPDTGEVNFVYLFDMMDKLGYEGWVGCEYNPKSTTEAGLDWFQHVIGRKED